MRESAFEGTEERMDSPNSFLSRGYVVIGYFLGLFPWGVGRHWLPRYLCRFWACALLGFVWYAQYIMYDMLLRVPGSNTAYASNRVVLLSRALEMSGLYVHFGRQPGNSGEILEKLTSAGALVCSLLLLVPAVPFVPYAYAVMISPRPLLVKLADLLIDLTRLFIAILIAVSCVSFAKEYRRIFKASDCALQLQQIKERFDDFSSRFISVPSFLLLASSTGTAFSMLFLVNYTLVIRPEDFPNNIKVWTGAAAAFNIMLILMIEIVAEYLHSGFEESSSTFWKNQKAGEEMKVEAILENLHREQILRRTRPKPNAFGFFILGLQSLGAIAMTVITYLIILLQFQYGETSG